MSELRKKGVTALIWDFLGRILTQSSGFIVTIVLARLLSPSDFGAIALIMVVIGITQVFSDVGLASALIQRKKLLEIHYSSVFVLNICTALILTLITYLLADIAENFFRFDGLGSLLEVVSILFILNGLGSVQYIRLRKSLNYRLISKIEVSSSLVSGLLGIGCAFGGLGVWSLVVQILAQSMFKTLTLWCFSEWHPQFEVSFKALKQLWSFGFRMFLVAMLNAITERVDYLVIGKLFAPAELGFFQRAKSVNSLVVQYSSASLMSVLFPVVSEIQYDSERLRNLIVKSTNMLALLVFFLVGELYIIAEPLIILLYGKNWSPSVPLLELLILSAFSYPLNALFVNILSGRGNSKAFLKMALIKKVIFFANLCIGFYWGVVGYLYGLVVVALLNTSISILFVSRDLSLAQIHFHKPIYVQIIITLLSVFIVKSIQEKLGLSLVADFLISGFVFFVLFFSVNAIFKTKSMNYLFVEISIFFKKNP